MSADKKTEIMEDIMNLLDELGIYDVIGISIDTLTKIQDGVLKILEEKALKIPRFENIHNTYSLTQSRKNDTHSRVFEFEFYAGLINLESVLYAFDSGKRNALKDYDYHELLNVLKREYDGLNKNIKHLEEMKKMGYE